MTKDDQSLDFTINMMDTDDIFLIEDQKFSLIMQASRERLPTRLEVASLLNIVTTNNFPSAEADKLRLIIDRMGCKEKFYRKPGEIVESLNGYLHIFPVNEPNTIDYLACRAFNATTEGEGISYSMNAPIYKILFPIVDGKIKPQDNIVEGDFKSICYSSAGGIDGDHVVDLLISASYMVLNKSRIKKLPESEDIAIMFDGAIEVVSDMYRDWASQYTVSNAKKILDQKQLGQSLLRPSSLKSNRGRA